MLSKAIAAVLFAAGLLAGVEAQIRQVTLNCQFGDIAISGNERYGCLLDDIDIDTTSPFYFIRIEGTHQGTQTNADVRNLVLRNSRTARIPGNIFNVFPNTEALEVDNVEGITFIPPDFFFAENLREVRIVNINLPTLGPTPFTLAPSIEVLILENNGMNSLGVNPFGGLVNVQHISFANNNIQNLTPLMTANLANLRHFDASNNNITEIDGRLFLNSPDLEVVNFSGNNLRAIGSNILNINENLTQAWFSGNDCVDDDFVVEGDVNLETIRIAMKQCFVNSPWGRQISVRVAGSVIIFNENNQVITTID